MAYNSTTYLRRKRLKELGLTENQYYSIPLSNRPDLKETKEEYEKWLASDREKRYAILDYYISCGIPCLVELAKIEYGDNWQIIFNEDGKNWYKDRVPQKHKLTEDDEED